MKNLPAIKPKKSVSPGDIFRLGSHILACGDATDGAFVERVLARIAVNTVITDPPYGVDYVAAKSGFKQKLGKAKDIAGDQLQSEEAYAAFTRDWLAPALPHLVRKNAVYIFNSDLMLFALREGMLAAGLRFSQLLVWVKNHAVVGRKDYLPQHELIAYGWSGTHEFRKSKDKSVLFFPKPNKSKHHPTTKPVSLIRHLILNSTPRGGVIYDPFAGSGTAILAAEQTRRACVAIELDPEYCQTIIERFERLVGTAAELLTELPCPTNPSTATPSKAPSLNS